ncbi:MAG: type VI secretion system contractile sheath small subunit [Candidatus Zixiibacteriota bacterium]|nr:MAG: type VI secretion system contractile sheath small subunit [candidate division Zixibacteria bacterium]
MAQKGSAPPKERVNITYRPATGDAKEEVELPLKVLVMGDFTLREDGTPLEDRKPLNIDRDNFSEVLAGQEVQFEGLVPDRLSGAEDAQLNVSLDFRSIRDFEPDAILEKVPELKKLMDLRKALKTLKGPLGNNRAFVKELKRLVQDPVLRTRILNELGLSE